MLQNEELKDDEGPSNTLEYFAELEQVLQMIDEIKSTDAPGFEKDFEQYTEVLTRYQEQPHLLDPHLDTLLRRLLTKIRNVDSPKSTVHAAFKYLYVISKVRTYKVLVKFLPHELSDLEFALNLLEKQDHKEFKNWETRYMLLLWLSILVLNPFHMSRLDAYDAHDTRNIASGEGLPTIKSKMERIYELCQIYSASNDTCSSIAAYLSAKYLIRADIKDLYLESYIDWVIIQHKADAINIKNGQLATIAAILKHGKREDLLPYADKILRWIISCEYQDCNDFLKYKNYIKIIQRIGLIYLKPRIAAWRYKRGTRSLVANLNQPEIQRVRESSTSNNVDENESEDGEEIIVPDAIEEIIQELLEGLRSGGSDIRWNAAKGIGRVTNRLPKDLADQVIGCVIKILNPLEPHEAWHGACLGLAELAKRGLLLPYRLHVLVPLLLEALFYDEMKGYMSVGRHIRDSACYMCWAFARAYNPDDLQPFVKKISAGLLTVTVFDREINCRRAASAAFQESVGRLGNFPYGIEICTTTDFYSVGLRQNSYLNISDFIAQYEEYRKPLINHLIERKVNHWDSAIRELTAKALHKLTFRDPSYMADVVLDKLFTQTDSVDINTRHGSVMAIGEIVLALKTIEEKTMNEGAPMDNRKIFISNQILSDLNNLLKKFLIRDLFRGMSGEAMKQCCTDFIRNCSLAKIQVTPTCLDCWQQVIDKCLIHKAAPIRDLAITAFSELCKAYYCTPERQIKNAEIVTTYLAGAASDLEEHIRMGYIGALGALPRTIIIPHLTEILDSLVKHSLTPLQAVIAYETAQEHENIITYTWSEARRDSVKALSNLIETVGFSNDTGSSDESFSNSKYFDKSIEAFLKAMDEYTLDNRGDIGALVREAAMSALHRLLMNCPKEMLQACHIQRIITGFMQQAVEKIDRTRGLAGRLFCNLIHATPEIPHIQHHARLKQIFPEDSSKILWLFADQTFPLFCDLLDLTNYSKRILLGLSASIGQLTESLIKYSSAALFQFLRTHPTEVPRICEEIVANFEENLLNERVTYPMLNFLDVLMGSGTINSVLLDPTNNFAEDIYRLLNQEVKGHKKFYKLISSISVYCQLIQVARLSKRILSKMAIFLGLAHVHVRKTAATKLYEALALHGECCSDISEEQMDEALSVLSETDWSLPLLEVRPIRNELCTLLGIKAPVSNISGTTTIPTTNNAGSASFVA